ncbi:hypothetical protein [Actinopolymorpha pittospori]|uniref:Uncharacterized protein n=1 Tax=Actinopolymorpha pittospori TaxID=648752 RepID=A0A927MVL6_9ACTN|nr:hypothetical protein [Actinopolymorpha pittospori]MBE1607715.1 hypothetical protein [Actinopolymorpha pittospori]
MTGRRSNAPRTVLEHLIWQRDQTYDEVAAEFEVIARQAGERGASMSARHLRRLASGQRTGMTPVTRRVLLRMFGRAATELVAPFEQALAGAGAACRVEPPDRPDGETPTDGGTRGESPGPAQERERFEVRPAGTFEPLCDTELLDRSARTARRFGMALARATLAEDNLERVYAAVRQLTHAYQQRPLPEDARRARGHPGAGVRPARSPAAPRTRPAAALRGGHGVRDVGEGRARPVRRPDGDSARTRRLSLRRPGRPQRPARVGAWSAVRRGVLDGPTLRSHPLRQAGADFATTDSTEVWLHASEARALAALAKDRQAIAAIRQAGPAAGANGVDRLDGLGRLEDLGDLDRMSARLAAGRPRYHFAADAISWLPCDLRAEVEVLTRLDPWPADGSPVADLWG